MPIARVSLSKTTWAKLNSRLGRTEHEATFKKLKETRVSHPPGGSAVLWEPTDELRTSLAEILEREETFVRRKGTCSHQELLAGIKNLRGT